MGLETEVKRVFKEALAEYDAEKGLSIVPQAVPKRFVGLITQNGVNAPTITTLENSTGIAVPILSTSYVAVGRYNFELDIAIHNVLQQNLGTLSVGTPIPQSYNTFGEKTFYNIFKNMTNIVELRSFFNGGGTNDQFQLSDNKIKQVKFEIELFN